MLLALLSNLGITLIVESGVSLLVSHKRHFRLLVVVACANVLTNPLAQVAYNYWFGNLWLIELIVIIAEAIIFCLFLYPRISDAIILSTLLNAASVLVGLLLYGVLLP